MPDFKKPNPNDQATRKARNSRLSDWLRNKSMDIVDIYLQTDDNGATTWFIVERDGTVHTLAN